MIGHRRERERERFDRPRRELEQLVRTADPDERPNVARSTEVRISTSAARKSVSLNTSQLLLVPTFLAVMNQS